MYATLLIGAALCVARPAIADAGLPTLDLIAQYGEVLHTNPSVELSMMTGDIRLAPDDWCSYTTRVSSHAGFGTAWITRSPAGVQRVYVEDEALPGLAPLRVGSAESGRLWPGGYMTLQARRPGSNQHVALLSGRPEQLRIVAQNGDAVPGLNNGSVWRAAYGLAVEVRTNGHEVVLGAFGPSGSTTTNGTAIVEYAADEAPKLLLRTGVPDGGDAAPPVFIKWFDYFAVSDDAVSVIAVDADNKSLLLRLHQGAWSVVAKSGDRLKTAAGEFVLSWLHLEGHTSTGFMLLRAGGEGSHEALIRITPNDQIDFVTFDGRPIGDTGEILAGVPSGHIAADGAVVFIASVQDSKGNEVARALAIDRAAGLAMLARSDEAIETNIGPQQVTPVGVTMNSRGQVAADMLPVASAQVPDARNALVMGWSSTSGWTVFAGRGLPAHTATTQYPLIEGLLPQTGGDYPRTAEYISNSGRIVFGLRYGTIECANFVGVIPDPGVGDANADGRVNNADLSVLLSSWGRTVTPGTGADYNGDGTVNATDLSILLTLFNHTFE